MHPNRGARLAAAAAILAAGVACAAPRPAAAPPPSPAPAAGEPASPADEALRAAQAAAAAGDDARLMALAAQLAGHPLESYVSYWQASARLHATEPDDSLVAPFLARYPGTVLADRLRADWLLLLADRGDMDRFDAERRLLVSSGDEAQLACYTLLSRYEREGARRAEAVVRESRRYLAQVSDPGGKGCSALADRLFDDGAMPIWPRLQALVERNQLSAAESTAERLPAAEAAEIKRVIDKPAEWLKANLASAGFAERAEHPLALFALVVLGREAPEDAAGFAEELGPSLGADERAIVWARIARSAQLKLLPQAHDWFARSGAPTAVGPEFTRANDVLEARARADLRDGSMFGADGAAPAAGAGPDWEDLLRTLAHMPPELQTDGNWVYWKAQALIAQGRADEGLAGLRTIAGRFNYYGRLAAEQLGLAFELAQAPAAPEAARVDELARRPGFGRARRLFELGLREEASREWSWELRGMDDASLHAAAELGRRLGVLDRMIVSSERMRGIVDLGERYPMPYPELMTETSAPLGIDPAWVYGLIRQESRFMEDIRSNAGAIGLMQLMPTTARYVARRIGFENFRSDRIAEVGVNLRLGSEYLKMVLDDQDGQALLASAAYNAGPRRVRRWRAALARPLDGALFVETIPIIETREYVKRVLFNTVVYGRLLQHPAVSLQSLLGPVTPKAVPGTDLP